MVTPAEIKKMLEEDRIERDRQGKMLDNITTAIFGNDKMDIEGMAHKVKRHEKYISTDKKIKWVLFGTTIAGTGSLWAYIKTKFGI